MMKKILLGFAILAIVSTFTFTSTELAIQQIADPTDCIKTKCPTQYNECVADPKCMPALQDCSKKCGSSQTCWAMCLNGKGSKAAIDTAKCAAANGCTSQEEQQQTAIEVADPTDCIKTKCPTQYNECVADPKCMPALQDCSKKCGSSQTCWAMCLNGKGSKAAIDTAKCAAANGCTSQEEQQQTAIEVADPTDCIKTKCPTQYNECVADPKCMPALQDCSKKCGSSQTCWAMCLNGKGSKAAIDTAKCAAANGCTSQEEQQQTAIEVADPTDCIKTKCPTQYNECVADPKCMPALQDCSKKCGSSQTCWAMCLNGKGSKAAIDTAKCAAANGCTSQEEQQQTAIEVADPTDCIKTKCPTQYNECVADPKCMPALQDCSKKCGSSQTCWAMCLNGKGSKAAIDTAKCAAANGCTSTTQEHSYRYQFEKCMINSCQSQMQDCLFDKTCRLQLLFCRIEGQMWKFNMECLKYKSSSHPKLNNWYACAEQGRCL